MIITYETNEYGENVKVTVYDSGHVIREIERPAITAAETRKAEIWAELAVIDAQTTKPRTIRELSLGNAEAIAWVQAQDYKAASLRAELAAL